MDTAQPNSRSDGEGYASSPYFKGLTRQAEGYLHQPSRLQRLLMDAATKFNGKKGWEKLPMLFRLVKATASGEYTELSTSTKVGAVAVIIYLVSPLDLVPDFIPVVGLLDDLALLTWFIDSIKKDLDKFAEWEKRQKNNQDNQDADQGSQDADQCSQDTDQCSENVDEGSQNSGQCSEDVDEGSQNADTRNEATSDAPTVVRKLWALLGRWF